MAWWMAPVFSRRAENTFHSSGRWPAAFPCTPLTPHIRPLWQACVCVAGDALSAHAPLGESWLLHWEAIRFLLRRVCTGPRHDVLLEASDQPSMQCTAEADMMHGNASVPVVSAEDEGVARYSKYGIPAFAVAQRHRVTTDCH